MGENLEKNIVTIRAELKELANEVTKKTDELKDLNDVQNEDIDSANNKIIDLVKQMANINEKVTELNVLNLKIEGIQQAGSEFDERMKADLDKVIQDSREADDEMHKLIESLRANLLSANAELLAKITNVQNDVEQKVNAVDDENREQNEKIAALDKGQQEQLERIVSLYETTVVYEERAKVVDASIQQSANQAKENVEAAIKENKESIQKISENVNESLEDLEQKYKDDINKMIDAQKKAEADLDGKLRTDLDNAIKESKEGDHDLLIMINDLRDSLTSADKELFDNLKDVFGKLTGEVKEGLEEMEEKNKNDLQKANDSMANEMNLLLVKINAVQDHSDGVKSDAEKLSDLLEDLQDKNNAAHQTLKEEMNLFTSNIQLTIKADQESNVENLEKNIVTIRAELKELGNEVTKKTDELKDVNEVQNEDIDSANNKINDLVKQMANINEKVTELNVLNLKIEGIQQAGSEFDERMKADLDKVIQDSREADDEMHKLIESLRANLLSANAELLAKITNVQNDVEQKVNAVDDENREQNEKIAALDKGQQEQLERIVSLHETTVVYEERAKVVDASIQQSANQAKENVEAAIKENKESIQKISENVNESLEDLEQKYKDDINKMIDAQKKAEAD